MLSPDLASLFGPILAAVALGIVIFVLAYPYLTGEKKAEKRIGNVTKSRTAKAASRAADEVAATRKKAVADTLKDLEQQKAKTKTKLTLRLRLQRAGIDAEPKQFWIASFGLGAVIAIATFFSLPASNYKFIMVGLLMFIGTFGLPRFILSKLIKRRQTKFSNELANAIDVVVRGVKSGLPLNECLQIIARESPQPIAGEFTEIVEEQRVGVPLGECLDRLIQRMPLPEVKFLSIVIAIQQQAGGNLSEALGNLANVLRDRQRIKMKVAALSAEAKSSAFVLGSLPPGVMTMVQMSSPDYIRPLFATNAGNVLLGIGALWMLMGCLMMRKMINFKF
jgi:tight adherence protein B